MLSTHLNFRSVRQCTHFVQRFSSESFRTHESNPSNHTKDNVSQFYTIPSDTKESLFRYGGFPKTFNTQVKTFCESSVMVRKPALNIIDTIKRLGYRKPTPRFVLYGEKGVGKSVTLIHVLHYAYLNNFLIVHVPWAAEWTRRCKESANSTFREDFIDLPIDSAAWLIHFRNQNAKLLADRRLVTSREHVWSKRETTSVGTSLAELIDHGINRVKYASEVVVALCEEIKQLSTSGVCKTLVAVDGYNAFFFPETRIKTDTKQIAPPWKLTLTEAFLNLTKPDWCNGVSVLTVDELAIPAELHTSYFPFYLLGKTGFEHLDPFVAVRVEKYSDEEFESCVRYYRNRLWIQTPGDEKEQNDELSHLSAYNPFNLMRICASL